MRLIPAIDILGGKCVRLREGDYASARVFGDNPAETARRILGLGARRLHVVDLDAAKNGKSENGAAIAGVLAAAAEFSAAVQIGGGLRGMDSVRRILAEGAAFAILGTAAAGNPAFLAEAAAEFPDKIILAADARNGRIALSGWREESEMHINELLDGAAARPPAAVIFTDIRRDGMLGGANVEATKEVAGRAPCPVYASGGVRGEDDVRALAAAHQNIAGAIMGRAMYENMDILKPLLEMYG